MEGKQVPKRLRQTFLLHAAAIALFALIYLIIPVRWGDFTGCLSNRVPQVFRLFGTSLLGYAVSSYLAYRERSLERVMVTFRTACVIHALFFVVIMFALVLWDLPSIGWLYEGFTGVFAIEFNLQYFKLVHSK